jgi:hypothetical protein
LTASERFVMHQPGACSPPQTRRGDEEPLSEWLRAGSVC